MRPLLTLATFLGSLALFIIEPLAAKTLLPRFGGSAFVWNGCFFFFQASLLFGYAYATVLIRSLSSRTVAGVHAAVLGLACILTFLLFIPTDHWIIRPPPGGDPIIPLLTTLVLTTAATFSALAAGTPLIQRFFAQSGELGANDPYFLYAASNLGSLCGLLSYPFLVEPNFTLVAQRMLVATLLTAYATLVGVAIFKLLRLQGSPAVAERTERAPWLERARWLLLSAAPSALLLAVTSDLTQNIGPIPLLWVAPLALYLLTFVIAFSRRAGFGETGRSAPGWFRLLLVCVLAAQAYATLSEPSPWFALAIDLALLFLLALGCHAKLAQRRPPPSFLADYYFWIALGGVAGGAFCALVAPAIFTRFSEFPIALGACVLFGAGVRLGLRITLRQVLFTAGGVLIVCGILAASVAGWNPLLLAAAIAALYAMAARTPLRLAMVFAAFLVGGVWLDERHDDSEVLFAGRNYYGALKVTSESNDTVHRLENGTILHGAQFTDAEWGQTPTTYYSEAGPLGQALKPILDAYPNARIGAVGLGAGTEAAYGRPGMAIDFFELNPLIKRLAENPRFFEFIEKSKASVRIFIGDGRLSLENMSDRAYDVIVLDAFSSDAIPVHLLTREAFQVYRQKLKPTGFIFVHATNHYLKLAKVVVAAAAAVGLAADLAEDAGTDDEYLRPGTTWLCLAANRTRLSLIQRPAGMWKPYPADSRVEAWTDDYSDVLGALKTFNR